jgi:hypothetical protein
MGRLHRQNPSALVGNLLSLATGSHGYTDQTREGGFGVRDKFLTNSVYEDFYGDRILLLETFSRFYILLRS